MRPPLAGWWARQPPARSLRAESAARRRVRRWSPRHCGPVRGRASDAAAPAASRVALDPVVGIPVHGGTASRQADPPPRCPRRPDPRIRTCSMTTDRFLAPHGVGVTGPALAGPASRGGGSAAIDRLQQGVADPALLGLAGETVGWRYRRQSRVISAARVGGRLDVAAVDPDGGGAAARLGSTWACPGCWRRRTQAGGDCADNRWRR
jgi:hypothetical protein